MSYQRIKEFRKERKLLMLAGFGSKCQCCGYDKCVSALEFHHLNPNEKEITLSKNIISWKKQKEELKKCICVCANCHREIHEGLRYIDVNKQYFDENLIKEYNPVKERPKEYDKCPICGQNKLKVRKYCSKSCSAKAQERVDWSKYDIVYWIDNKIKSIYQIANELDISFAAVKKRYKKLKKSS